MGAVMKKTIFTIILLTGLSATASEPTIMQIANAFFRHAGMSVSNVEINPAEDMFVGANVEEIFFNYNGVYYNCYIQKPQINYNPVHRIYNTTRFMINNCENYANGEEIELPLSDTRIRRAQGDFINGIGFYNNNTQFETTRALYSRERIGDRP